MKASRLLVSFLTAGIAASLLLTSGNNLPETYAGTVTAEASTAAPPDDKSMHWMPLLLLGSESVSDTIGPAGGYLEIQDAKDNLYRLIIPQGALTEQKLITIKLTAAGGFASLLGPLSGSLALFPQGLTFSTPAKLEIVLSKNTSIPPIPAIYLEEETGKPGILLEVVQSGQTLTASLEHFSTATAVGPNALELQHFIDIAKQQISQWETNCAATSQMAEKRKFYKDTVELEYFILQVLDLWGLYGDFGFEPRTGAEDYCGGLFDHKITYINICYDGTCWPPGMGNVEMEVNEQRQFDYKIACVNGFCQGNVIWFIPLADPNNPPIASVTQSGVVTGLREGTGELQALSKEFTDVPDIILGQVGLKVRPGGGPCRDECGYGGEGGPIYTKYCVNNCTNERFETSQSIDYFNGQIERSSIWIIKRIGFDTLGRTKWFNLQPSTGTPKCVEGTNGWATIITDNHETGISESFSSSHVDMWPQYYKRTGSDRVSCWPGYSTWTRECGAYACPSYGIIRPLYPFPGDCHQWWDHFDENNVWVECGY